MQFAAYLVSKLSFASVGYSKDYSQRRRPGETPWKTIMHSTWSSRELNAGKGSQLIVTSPLSIQSSWTFIAAWILRFPQTSCSGKPAQVVFLDYRGDVTRHPHGLTLTVKWSKTIHFKERNYFVPLPYLQGHPLCQITANLALIPPPHLSKDVNTPLFSISQPPSRLNQQQFEITLQRCLASTGLPANLYSGHSFLRGGAFWAFKAGFHEKSYRLWVTGSLRITSYSGARLTTEICLQYQPTLQYSVWVDIQ